jgi:leucyl aminopeptidase
MEYFATTSAASRRVADCVIVGIYENGRLGTAADDVNTASGGIIKQLIKSGDLSDQLGSCTVLRDIEGVGSARVAVVGLGKYADFGVTQYRKALLAALQAVSKTKSSEILNALALEETGGTDIYYLARFTAEAVGEALYRFTAMKSGKGPKLMPLRKIGLAVSARGDARKAKLGAEHGEGIVAGVNLARELGNLPANVCTPSHLARTAQKIARENKKVTTRVLNESEMKRLGMHSLLSVTAGSDEPAKLIVMQYKG